jgi:hypothetical protein
MGKYQEALMDAKNAAKLLEARLKDPYHPNSEVRVSLLPVYERVARCCLCLPHLSPTEARGILEKVRLGRYPPLSPAQGR